MTSVKVNEDGSVTVTRGGNAGDPYSYEHQLTLKPDGSLSVRDDLNSPAKRYGSFDISRDGKRMFDQGYTDWYTFSNTQFGPQGKQVVGADAMKREGVRGDWDFTKPGPELTPDDFARLNQSLEAFRKNPQALCDLKTAIDTLADKDPNDKITRASLYAEKEIQRALGVTSPEEVKAKLGSLTCELNVVSGPKKGGPELG